MRQTISGLIAAIAVVTASAVPAMACGDSPCGPVYIAAPVYSGCYSGCGRAHERLPDPVQQYYYADQGPTYTGPGNFAPYPVYRENAVPYYYGHRTHPYFHSWHTHHNFYGYPHHHSLRYGYAPHHGYASHYSMSHHYGYGHREHTLRRYY